MRMTQAELDDYNSRQGVSHQEKKAISREFNPLEDEEQKALAQLLDLLKLKWCHVPNGGDRDVRVAAKLKGHGVKRGVPDVLIFDTPPNYPESKGAVIELKRRRGGVLSGDQREWLEFLQGQGWSCCVAKGWEDAKLFLTSLGWTL